MPNVEHSGEQLTSPERRPTSLAQMEDTADRVWVVEIFCYTLVFTLLFISILQGG